MQPVEGTILFMCKHDRIILRSEIAVLAMPPDPEEAVFISETPNLGIVNLPLLLGLFINQSKNIFIFLLVYKSLFNLFRRLFVYKILVCVVNLQLSMAGKRDQTKKEGRQNAGQHCI